MPAPASVQELLELVQKSGVTDEGRLKTYLARLTAQGGVPADPPRMAQFLVRDGLLTFFQAEQLLQGKWKRFSLGKYKVLEKLGSGGMGQVFLCEHKLMRRRVAVKVLPTNKAQDKASLERFYREARAVAALDHPNIVRAYDIDQDENLHFLVMEYVDGTNLQDLVRKFGPLDVLRACHYVYGGAVGLQHAHEIGLVHRDIKPGNILIDRSGVVKILDMGLARFFHDETDAITRQYDENVLGTADYLSPEQALDSHTVDIRADVYSLGATFYYLLTGSAPFPDGSVAQKLIWHQSREPRLLKSLRPEVPDEVVFVVQKMMAKRPEDRYQTPAELMAALAPFVTTPIPPPEERELPQLSPAASGSPTSAVGTRGTGSGPALASRVGAGAQPPSLSGSPTVVAPAATWPGTAPTPSAGNRVWESLGDDTQPVVSADTARPRPTRPPAADRGGKTGPPSARKPRGKMLPVLLAGGLLLLLGGAAFGVWYGFLRTRSEAPSQEPPAAAPHRLVVAKTGEGTFPSLALALKKADPGDTIVIADERIAEPTVRFPKLRDVTIESGLPDGKSATIEFAAASGPVLDVADWDNVRVRNLELDGKGTADVGVSVSGVCRGVTFENLTVRGVRQTGFKLRNAAGDAGRPILMDRCRVVLAPAGETAVSVTVDPRLECRALAIRNCRFEGPGKAGVRLDGPMSDVEVSGNRLFKLDDGFVFGQAPDNKVVKVRVTGNTVFDAANAGVRFEAGAKGKMDVVIAKNYFGKTPAVAKADEAKPEDPPQPIPGVEFKENGFGPGSGPGNVQNSASAANGPELKSLNPDDDATFLKFPADAGPTVGAKKERVGVN
jgi:serine/threonine protein kinase